MGSSEEDFGAEELTPTTLRSIRGRRLWQLRTAVPAPLSRSRQRPGPLRFILLLALGGGLGALLAVGAAIRPWWSEAIALADRHTALLVAHPGWSFPARVDSAPLPSQAPPEVQLEVAALLGYREHCPPGPGERCTKTKRVTPRRGNQLEPLTLGWLLGPDAELREHLPLHEAPRHLTDAIIAAEDREFREHQGVSLSGMLRATLRNAREGSYAQGASTLTMQVVRAWNQQRDRTVLRKLREMVMALAVDRHLGKDGILQAYLDAPYLGQRRALSICGFQAAARHYYGKDAKDLDLSEAATLAAILPSPGTLAPDRAPALAKEKRDRVLRAMEGMGYDIREALQAPIRTVPPGVLEERFPAYLSAVRAALLEQLSPAVVQGAGLRVTAAVDLYMQEESEKLLLAKTHYLEGLVPPKKSAEPLQSAAVLIDVETGNVRAIYGGDTQISTDWNRATQSRRQGGSAFKPLVYALALSTKAADGKPRYTAASVEPNVPRVFHTPQGDWRPRNVTGEYSETACLANALAWSMNIATASLLEELGGPKPLIRFAARAGFDTRHFPEELGLALGQAEVTPLEMADFAATIARGGKRLPTKVVLSVVDARGEQRWPEPPQPELVMSPEAAALTRELLRGVVDFGTGGAARGAGEPGYAGQLLGKTGTTDEEKDLWFVGATPRYAGVVWLGYDRPASIGASASDLAAPLWGWWMNRLTIPDGPPPTFSDRPKLSRRGLCSITGRLAGPSCHAVPASFLPGTEPKEACAGEHPPDPTYEAIAHAAAAVAAGEKPLFESIWKRLAREKEEALRAKGGR